MTPTGQEASDSCAVGTRALYPEGVDRSQAAGPPLELLVPTGGRGHVVLAKSDTSPVNGHCHMLVFVSVDSDDHLSCAITLVTCDSDHVCLLDDGVSAG